MKCVDNLLVALISNKLDDMAIDYMGLYKHLVDSELFNFCLQTGNTNFLQTALNLNAFDKLIFRNTEVMTNILDILRDGHRTIFLLNVLVLVLSDVAIFKFKYFKMLIEVLKDFVL